MTDLYDLYTTTSTTGTATMVEDESILPMSYTQWLASSMNIKPKEKINWKEEIEQAIINGKLPQVR